MVTPPKKDVRKMQRPHTNMYVYEGQQVQTWQPFFGCLYDCAYCKLSYKIIGKRVGTVSGCENCINFKPHPHPERLTTLVRKKDPETGEGFRTLWPCAHSDITSSKTAGSRSAIISSKIASGLSPSAEKTGCSPEALKPLAERESFSPSLERASSSP